MLKKSRKTSRVKTVIRDALFTVEHLTTVSVSLPVGPVRVGLRHKISTRWIERPTGQLASAYLQERGRIGALDGISEAEGFSTAWFHASPLVQANSALILFYALAGRLVLEGGVA